MPHVTNETLRKLLHIAVGFAAFLLHSFPWWATAGFAALFVLSNMFLLPRIGGKHVARHERGYDAGIVLYPAMVALLIVVFRNQLHYAGIAWAVLAFGDGIATLAGKSLRIAPLPWHREKSWGGFIACFLGGAAGGLAVAWFLGYHKPAVVLIAALAGAIVESLPLRVDDNVTVPLAAATAAVIAGFEVVSPYGTWPHTVPWLIVNAGLALAGYFAKSVNFSGAIGGWFLGTILILGAGWPMYVALLAFFVLGTAATKLGYQRKAKAGLAQEGGGRRGFSHAFSNVGVAAICAVAVSRIARTMGGATELELLPMFMGIASLATAAADTTASEIGQLVGRRAFLPLTLRRVPVGTEGAISIEGTLAGALAGLAVGVIGFRAVQVLFRDVEELPWSIAWLIALCAFLGSYLESIAGSWNRKRITPVPNGVLNFFNTAAGALLMYGAWQIAQ